MTKKEKRSKVQLSSTEIFATGLAMLILAASGYFYFSNTSLRRYFLGWEDSDKLEQVAKLGKRQGNIRRQTVSSTEFQAIDTNAILFNYDTLVTGPESRARIQLDDGGIIELEPNTMVRLAFESSLSIGGISRAPTIDVVVGNVKGEAKAKPILLRSGNERIPIVQGKVETIKITVPPKKREAQPIVIPAELPVLVEANASPSPEPMVAEAEPEPQPEPSPTIDPYQALLASYQVIPLTPKNGAQVELEKGAKGLQREVALEWSIQPANAQVQVTLRKIVADDDPEVLLEQVIAAKDAQGALKAMLKYPGSYEWEIKGPKGETLGAKPIVSKFVFSGKAEGIALLPPLVSGQKIANNAMAGKPITDFAIQLRWKPVPGASSYQIKVLNAPNAAKPIAEAEVNDPEFVFSKGKIFSGTVYYTVGASLKNGFNLSSTLGKFTFQYSPPTLVLPASGSSISKQDIMNNNNNLLLTWRKTNFTEGYELEVGYDQEFKKVAIKKRVKDNFFALRNPPAGTYWWRVRSYLEKTVSEPSTPFEFKVTP